jgi:DNA-binding NtrC family response regulator
MAREKSVLQPSEGVAAPKHRTVLVVNREPAMNQLLQTLLTNEGYTALAATDLDTAARLLSSVRFDVVIADYMELQFRRGERWPILEMFKALVDPGTPFIILTTSPQAMLESAEQLGIADVIEKPFDLGSLLERIKKAITGRERLIRHKHS